MREEWGHKVSLGNIISILTNHCLDIELYLTIFIFSYVGLSELNALGAELGLSLATAHFSFSNMN